MEGFDIVMQGNCTCGEKFDILGWFQYECECPACHTHYHCESHLTLTKLSAEEAALVEQRQRCRKGPRGHDRCRA